MFDTKQFASAIKQIAEEKGIAEDRVHETIEAAIAAAYKKEYGQKGQIVRAKLNLDTGDLKIDQVKIVVEGVDEEGNIIGDLPEKLSEHEFVEAARREEREEAREKFDMSRKEGREDQKKAVETDRENQDAGSGKTGPEVLVEGGSIGDEAEQTKPKFNPEKHVTLEDAKKIDKKLKIGDELVTALEPKMDFGRIAAQTAKQVIIQRLREVEREAIFGEYKKKEGEVVSGAIQRKEGHMIYIDLGRTNGLLIPMEQVYGENYKIGQRLRFLILRVEETPKGPAVLLSRAHPKLVLKLFQFEVPEIDAGTVEIKAIAREPGSRSKVAVMSHEEGVDPIGSLVGQRGVRVQTVINELGGEKIDIIQWHEDSQKFIANSLSPAKVVNIKILDDQRKHALAEVADDQFSLAIGKHGQNVRLAAKLTGWRIDVRSPQAQMTAEEALTTESQKEGESAEAKVETEKIDESSESPEKEKKAKNEKKESKKKKKEADDVTEDESGAKEESVTQE
ncbi:MAG: transcription termination/antitermination protein NusA [Candidatus Yanofskybacteria bacterium]|nr:transcription termination/antitermination protein NusA [Candidatus Yanofskybacteria bacterium]